MQPFLKVVCLCEFINNNSNCTSRILFRRRDSIMTERFMFKTVMFITAFLRKQLNVIHTVYWNGIQNHCLVTAWFGASLLVFLLQVIHWKYDDGNSNNNNNNEERDSFIWVKCCWIYLVRFFSFP